MKELAQMLLPFFVLFGFGTALVYFSALSQFRRALITHHPDMLASAQERALPTSSGLQIAYGLLSKFNGDRIGDVQLEPRALEAARRAKRWLYISAAGVSSLVVLGLFLSVNKDI